MVVLCSIVERGCTPISRPLLENGRSTNVTTSRVCWVVSQVTRNHPLSHSITRYQVLCYYIFLAQVHFYVHLVNGFRGQLEMNVDGQVALYDQLY